MKMLKTLTAVREDLRNFFVPAWLNKASQSRGGGFSVAKNRPFSDNIGSTQIRTIVLNYRPTVE